MSPNLFATISIAALLVSFRYLEPLHISIALLSMHRCDNLEFTPKCPHRFDINQSRYINHSIGIPTAADNRRAFDIIHGKMDSMGVRRTGTVYDGIGIEAPVRENSLLLTNIQWYVERGIIHLAIAQFWYGIGIDDVPYVSTHLSSHDGIIARQCHWVLVTGRWSPVGGNLFRGTNLHMCGDLIGAAYRRRTLTSHTCRTVNSQCRLRNYFREEINSHCRIDANETNSFVAFLDILCTERNG